MPKITAERLRQLLNYDPLTGMFTWLVVRRSAHGATRIGAVAGQKTALGYWHIGILRHTYSAHRLAWLHFYGTWPAGVIDHIDRNPLNNSILNLRDVTQKQNSENCNLSKNSTSGINGVYAMRNGRWTAKIKHHRKSHHLGCFATKEEAAEARKNAEAKLFTTCVPQFSYPDGRGHTRDAASDVQPPH